MSKVGKQVADATFSLLDRTKKEVKKIIRATARDVIKNTPFDTGRLKNNWYASNRKPPTQSTKQADKTGINSLARVEKTLDRLKVGQTFYLANNLPYARTVEFGLYPNPPKSKSGKTINGFSRKAPQGMLRIAVQKAISGLSRG